MPTSVVHAALAFVLAVGLLGAYYGPRALAVVLAVIIAPELDALLGFVMPGAHRTVLHTMVLSAVLAGLVYWDIRRPDSWLRNRWGDYGVRVAWVALFVHVFAHIALDWTHLDGINILWPLVDQFVALDGELYISSEGLVQTFVDVSLDPATGQQVVDAGQSGTTQSVHVSTPVQPTKEPEGPVDRRFPIAVGGWQLYLILVGAFTLIARRIQTPRRQHDQ